MNPRFVTAETSSNGALPDLVAIRAAAAEARDAEIGRMFRRVAGAVFGSLRWLFDTAAEWQERRATYERLRMMSDRDLEDVGLTRDQITRVFDPSWAQPRQEAPTPAAAPATIPAPANDAVAAPARAA